MPTGAEPAGAQRPSLLASHRCAGLFLMHRCEVGVDDTSIPVTHRLKPVVAVSNDLTI